MLNFSVIYIVFIILAISTLITYTNAKLNSKIYTLSKLIVKIYKLFFYVYVLHTYIYSLCIKRTERNQHFSPHMVQGIFSK